MSGVVCGQLDNFYLKKWSSQGLTCDALISQLNKQMWMNMLGNVISNIETLFRMIYMFFTVNLKGFCHILLSYCSSTLCNLSPL